MPTWTRAVTPRSRYNTWLTAAWLVLAPCTLPGAFAADDLTSMMDSAFNAAMSGDSAAPVQPQTNPQAQQTPATPQAQIAPAAPQSQAAPTTPGYHGEFVVDPAVSERIKKKFEDGLTANASADQKAQIHQAFASIKIMPLVEQEVQKYGFHANDLGVAMATWVSISMAVLNDKESSDAEDTALANQFRRITGNDAHMQTASDAEKQQAAEALYWTAIFLQLNYDQAKAGTPGYDMAKIKASAANLLRQHHLDPDYLEITDKGLSLKTNLGTSSRPAPIR